MPRSAVHSFLIISFLFFHYSLGARMLDEQPLGFTYHKGALLTGPISVNLIWYGRFSPSQRAIVSDFFSSLTSSSAGPQTVAAWWKTIDHKYYHHHSKSPFPTLLLGQQFIVDSYPLGKSLTEADLTHLASKGAKKDAINVALTAEDIAVDGFCMSRCDTHDASPPSKASRFAYIWVGNSATQCPEQCAWPFHQPIYGPQRAALVAPNGNVRVYGIEMNLASMVAGAVTNPFGNGFYQGPKEAPREAATACLGVYGTGAYPGYIGELLVDTVTGGSCWEEFMGDNPRILSYTCCYNIFVYLQETTHAYLDPCLMRNMGLPQPMRSFLDRCGTGSGMNLPQPTLGSTICLWLYP